MIKYKEVATICSLYRLTNKLVNEKFINKTNIELSNDKLMEINKFIDKYKLSHSVLEMNENKDLQLTFVYFSGTNGIEGNIKSSLLEVYNLMNEIEKEHDVVWIQVLDVSIDSLDDVYSFAITIIFKK